MKFLIAVAALVAIASANPALVRDKRGVLSYAAVDSVLGSSSHSVISGPSGQIVSTQSNPAVVARSIYPGVVAAPSVYAAGAYAAAPLVAAPYAAAPYAALPYAAVAPGVTAGTVYAPGTTLVGPSTNGAPGAVITNTPYGSAVYV